MTAFFFIGTVCRYKLSFKNWRIVGLQYHISIRVRHSDSIFLLVGKFSEGPVIRTVCFHCRRQGVDLCSLAKKCFMSYTRGHIIRKQWLYGSLEQQELSTHHLRIPCKENSVHLSPEHISSLSGWQSKISLFIFWYFFSFSTKSICYYLQLGDIFYFTNQYINVSI